MSETSLEVVRELHRRYERGDLDGVARLLHPGVVWHGVLDPEFDCHDRDDVLAVFAERMHRAPPLESLELLDLGDDVMVGLPLGPPWEHPAFYQRVRVEDGLVVAIQDFGPREDALRGATARP